LGVLVACAFILLGGPAREASAAPVAITEAPALQWGFKLSWRVYAGAPAVSAGATVVGDPGPAAHDLGWTFHSGSYDAETGTTVLSYKGTAHWTGHNSVAEGWAPPPGYGGPPAIDLLDVTVSDPVITISRDTATISAGAVSRDLNTWQLVDYGRVALVDLGADATTPTVAGGVTTWNAIRATTDAAGGPVFGSTYPAGTNVDQVGFSYTGPGGAPDFSEDFDPAGTIRMEPDGDNVLLTPADSPNGSYETFAVDSARQLVHYRVRDGAGDWTYQAFDLTTMQKLGNPLTVSWFDFDPPAMNDTSSGKLYAFGFFDAYPRRWIRFDPDLGTYVQGESAEPVPTADDNIPLAWDPAGQRAYEVVRTLADGTPAPRHDDNYDAHQWQLRTYTERPDGTWAVKGYDLPNRTPNLNGTVYQRLGTTAADGSLILLGAAQTPYPDTSAPAPDTIPGAYRVVTHDDGTAEVTAIPGSEVSNGPQAQYTGAEAGPDGTVALVNTNGSTTVQQMDVTPATGPIHAGPVVETGFLNADVRASAIDPEDGTIWLAGLKSRRLVGVKDGRIVADQVLPMGNTRVPALIAGPGHALFMQSNDGSDDNLQQHASGFQKLKRVGVSPTVTADPQDAETTLGTGVEGKDVTLSAAATGDPAPSLQWQAKAPGATRFKDIDNQTDATLTVSARRGMDGTLYRAVFTNAGGRIATEPATLGVAYAPEVRVAPLDAKVAPGHDATFQVVGVGNPEPSVQWQYRVGGFWQPIEPEDDNFAIEPGRLIVKDTNLEQSGTPIRARLRNSVASTFTRTATLTVVAPGARSLTGVRLDWSGSQELQRKAPNGTSSYFSAGTSTGNQATYAASAPDVRVLQVAAGGAEQPAGWTTRDQHLTSGGRQLVRLMGGTGAIAPDGSATVSWPGSFTVNMYGGLVPFTVRAPTLTLDADGDGKLAATLAGYASSQANPNERTPLASVAGVTLATFSGGRIDPSAPSTLTPGYAGVEVDLPAGQVQQLRSGEGWGAWPQAFVDFQVQTGLGSYWYSSGGAADPYKVPAPIVVTVTGESDEEPGPTPPTPPTPPHPQPPTPPAPPKPQAKAKAATITPLKGMRRVDGIRRVALATLTCPGSASAGAGSCAVTAPKRVTVRIAGKSYSLAVRSPKSVAAGRKATVRVQLSKAAATRLKGRSARLSVKLTIARQGVKATRTVTVTVWPARRF
jgi:hypothetical protein